MLVRPLAPTSWSGRRPQAVAAAAGLLVADVALAVALFAQAWAHPTAVTVGHKTDAPYTVWAMAWVARALSHGMSPWVTHALSWPTGVNLLTNATMTGVGMVLAPVTWLWGPLVAFNVAATASLALTAWTAQVVLRRTGLVSWPAAGVGGLVAGFGPTALTQASGAHLHVAAAFLVPPFLFGVGRLATGTARSPVRWGVALGLLAVGQILVGEELLAIAAITAAVGLAAAAVVRRLDPKAGKDLATGLGLAAGVFALLGAVPLWIQFRGPDHIRGPIQIGVHYANDLVGLVVPSGPLRFKPFAGAARHFSTEGGSYLGIPLVVVAVLAARRAWSQRLVRVVALTAAVLVVLSLGSPLQVAGDRTPIWLPWGAVAHLPLLVSLLPVRFGVVLDFLAGGLLAVAMDLAFRWSRGRFEARGRHYATAPVTFPAVLAPVALAALCLVPLTPALPFPASRWAIPAVFRSPGLSGIRNGALLVLGPYPGVAHPEVEMWLAVAGARWRSAGGSYFVPDATGHITIGGPAPLPDVIEASLEQGLPAAVFEPQRQELLGVLAHDHFAAVLIGRVPHREVALKWWTGLLGPPREIDGVAVFLTAR